MFWQFTAQVIDRLIYLLAGVTITISMFYRAMAGNDIGGCRRIGRQGGYHSDPVTSVLLCIQS